MFVGIVKNKNDQLFTINTVQYELWYDRIDLNIIVITKQSYLQSICLCVMIFTTMKVYRWE